LYKKEERNLFKLTQAKKDHEVEQTPTSKSENGREKKTYILKEYL